MVASPSPEYAQKLGESLYQMAGLEWLAIEVIRRLDASVAIETLAGMTTRGIADQLKSKVARATDLDQTRREELEAIGNAYADLPPVRNDVAHARPATAADGQQQLYRWAPTQSPFVGFVDDDFLDDLLARIREISRRLDSARAWLPEA